MLRNIIPLMASLTALLSTLYMYAVWSDATYWRPTHFAGMIAKAVPLAVSLTTLAATLFALVGCRWP